MLEVTQELLRRLLSYDPSTGALTWRERPPEAFKAPADYASWQATRTGKEAGYIHAGGYRVVQLRISGKKRFFSAHRVIWLYVTGAWPTNEIDHINRDRTDNRWGNLRDVSHQMNMRNRLLPSCGRGGSTGGVSQVRKNGRWRAYYYVGLKQRHVGTFSSREEASQALRALGR
jgi:hypothetical protein